MCSHSSEGLLQTTILRLPYLTLPYTVRYINGLLRICIISESWQPLNTESALLYLKVNGVKLADILFSLLCECVSVCLCALSPVFNSVCPSHNTSAISLPQPITWRIYALSECLLVIIIIIVSPHCKMTACRA